MAEEISIKKSTYNKILVTVVVLAVALSFAAGFIMGGGKLTGATTGTIQQQQQAQEQPSQQVGWTQTGVTALKQYAKDLGLNTAQFDSCLDSRKYEQEVQKDFQEGQSTGVGGTPTFFIGNPDKGYIGVVGAQPYSSIKQVIDSELNGQNSEASRVQVSLDDDPVLGDANAPVTVIEFSDFQCPYCARAFGDAVAGIKKDYVATGKVKFVYRDFTPTLVNPDYHPQAVKASIAAECADEQGKFWEYHDILFQNQ